MGAAATPDLRVRWAALAGIAGVLIYIVTTVAAAVATPGYDPVSEPVSALAAVGAPHRVVVSLLGFALPGLATMVLAWGLQRGVPGGAARPWGPRALGVAGAALVLLVAFPCAPGCAFPDPRTLRHSAVAAVALGSWVAMLLLVPRFREAPAWRDVAGFSRLTGVLVPVLVVLYLLSTSPPAPPTFLSPLTGVLERAAIYVGLLWSVVVGWHLYRVAS